MKLAWLFHLLLWPALMSVLTLVALLTPASQPDLGFWLAGSGIASFLISGLMSWRAAQASRRWLAWGGPALFTTARSS